MQLSNQLIIQSTNQLRKKLVFIGLLVFIGIYWYLLPPTVAAQSFNLGITPPLLETMIMPGRSITKVYKLLNQGADCQVYARIVSFEPADELGNIKLTLTPTDYSLQPWLNWYTFANADVSLPGGFKMLAGQTQELVLKIFVPEEAIEKDYYSSLVFTVNPPYALVGTSGTQTSAMLASNILLTVSKDGLPPKTGKIMEFTTKKILIFDSFDTVPITLKVANTGRTVFKPNGTIKILNMLGKEVKQWQILPQNILAFSQRQLFVNSDNEDSPAEALNFKPSFLAFGNYQAKADLTIAETDKTMEANLSFIIFPWKLGVGLLIGSIILMVIKKFIKK